MKSRGIIRGTFLSDLLLELVKIYIPYSYGELLN